MPEGRYRSRESRDVAVTGSGAPTGTRAGATMVVAMMFLIVTVAGCTATTGRRDAGTTRTLRPSATATTPAATPPPPDGTGTPDTTATRSQDPAKYAKIVITYARKAGINPQLLMAILYNEAYKPHDPAVERAWQRIKPDAAFGIANMHKAAFDDTKQGRDFADRNWQELPDDPALAIEAAAWFLHDLNRQLPRSWPARYTRDELLALGDNAGGGRMTAFADGAKPGSVAQGYLDKLHANWADASTAIRRAG